MALIRCGNGITEIQGTMAGNVFSKDSSGLHIQSHQRRVKNRSTAQKLQRKSFTLARMFSKDNRSVSYNIYRVLNGLDPQTPPADYPVGPFE